jgi:hypothetical protein
VPEAYFKKSEKYFMKMLAGFKNIRTFAPEFIDKVDDGTNTIGLRPYSGTRAGFASSVEHDFKIYTM